MDSISQATLGAAIGETLLGRKVGNKAVLWGAVAGTLPDLDVLAYPLMDQIAQLGWHRGPSHAFFYLTVAAPVMGWLISRIHRSQTVSWRRWTLLVYLAFITHVLLDAFTVYGTQWFRPFSDWPVGFDSISIVDPLYTLPLLISVIVVLFFRYTSPLRRRIVGIGLMLSTLYLGTTVATKFHVNDVAEVNFDAQGIDAERYITTPTLFNTILWRITAEADDGFYVGYHSLLDKDDDIEFHYLPQNDSLLLPLAGTDALQRLRWFSRGYYVVSEVDGRIHLADIRFGTLDAGQPESRRFVFEWQVEPSAVKPKRGKITKLDFPDMEAGLVLSGLWRRIRGE